MRELVGRGPAELERLWAAAERFAAEYEGALGVPPEVAAPVWACTLLAPVPDPGALRDFYAFEQHVATAYRARGREVPRAWYEVPVFFFVHAGNVHGPDEPVRRPEATRELDFELEVACVIGLGGRDIPVERAWEHVAGLTILNDWSARDVQRQEMSVGLGPAKAKDFASSLGPYLVTLDELEDRLEKDRHDLWMVARVDGEEVSRGNLRDLYWSFPQMIARASEGVDLLPGDLIGSGTVGTGCILELGPDVVPWLEPGNEVELEVERLGRLRTMIE
jgi:fumarylacetoacetate (FAA) hydrolase